MKKKIFTPFFLLLSFCWLNLSVSLAQNYSKPYSDSLLALAKKFYNEGLFKEATDLYKDAGFEKLTAEESFYLGLSFSNLRSVIKASQYFKRAVELAPEHNGYRLHLARTFSQLGKTNEALMNYEEIIKRDSNNVSALYEEGLINFDKREYGNAILLFEKLVKLNNNDFMSSYYLGYSMLLSPNPHWAEQAAKHLEYSVALNREFIPAVTLLASQNFNLKKYYEANALYSIARKLRPENAEYNFKSGLCFERLKFFSEAVKLYSKAIELDSNDANYFDHLGFTYFNMNKYDSAANAYKIAASLDENPAYYVNLGFAYAKIDSVEKSIEAFQNGIKLMQLDKIGYIYNQIAAVYFSKQNWKESKSAYQKTLVYNPGNIDAQFYIAMINEKQMDWRSASLAYKKVIQLATGDSSLKERIEYSQKKIKELKRKIVLEKRP